jgi:tRNA(fMet)-specific endonuclease VapC
MSYLIDTDYVIDFLNGRQPAIQTIGGLAPAGTAISIITYIEVYEGIIGSRAPMPAEKAFRDFRRGVTLLSLNTAVARRAAQIRNTLRRQRHPLQERALDILIAATAIHHDLTLVTRDLQHYNDIQDLKLY